MTSGVFAEFKTLATELVNLELSSTSRPFLGSMTVSPRDHSSSPGIPEVSDVDVERVQKLRARIYFVTFR